MNRSQAGRLGAHSVHARGLTNTGPAKAAFDARFVREVDPEGVLDPDELDKRLTHAKSLYFSRLIAKRWAK